MTRSHLPGRAAAALRSRWLTLGALGGIASVAALALQEYLGRHWHGGPMSYSTMLFAQLIGAGMWIVLFATIVKLLAERVPISFGGAALHLFAGVAVATVHTLMVAIVFATYYYPGSLLAIRDVFRDRMHTDLAWNTLVYLLLVAALIGRGWHHAPVPNGLQTKQAAEQHLRRVLVRVEGRVVPVRTDQIDWLEAADNNVVVHAGSIVHHVRGTLTAMLERLDPNRFVRVHRGAVVNVDRVREVQTWFHGELIAILQDDTRLTIGRTYRDTFMALLES